MNYSQKNFNFFSNQKKEDKIKVRPKKGGGGEALRKTINNIIEKKRTKLKGIITCI